MNPNANSPKNVKNPKHDIKPDIVLAELLTLSYIF